MSALRRLNAVLPRVAVTLFAAALISGIWRYGATETWQLYRLFLLTAIPVLLVAWVLLTDGAGERWRLLSLALIGCFLFVQVALQPTLQGRGYVLAAVGWMALFLSFALASRSRRQARGLVLFLILAGGLEAAYGLVQSLGESDSVAGATGTFVNRNHFAGMLNMTLPLALGALLTRHYRRSSTRSPRSETWAWTWVVLLSCSFMGLAVLLSLSKGGVLTLAATLAFMACILALRRRASRRGDLPGLVAWLLLLTILGLGLAVGLGALSQRFARFSEAWQDRGTVYADSLRLIRDHAALGVGPGMYRWRFRPYQTAHPERRYDHAHNDYLETAADWGIPTAVLIWGFIGWRFFRVSARLFTSRSVFRQGLALGCSGALFSILVHSLVDFNLQIPTNLMIFCTILGLAWSLDVAGRNSGAPRPRDAA